MSLANNDYCKCFSQMKVKGFSLIETIVSLTIISIIFTITLMSYSNIINSKHDTLKLKALITMQRIQAELQRENHPIETILQQVESPLFNIDYQLKKNTYTYRLYIEIKAPNGTILSNKSIVLRGNEF